ncbi:hypothetical protein HDE_12634 [Halotydeus destructor]|nr:hypothetical protein HDE_12634 [Halotydeus destructor]
MLQLASDSGHAMSTEVKFVSSQSSRSRNSSRYWYVDHGFFGYVISGLTVVFTGAHILLPVMAYQLVTQQAWATFFWGQYLVLVILAVVITVPLVSPTLQPTLSASVPP